MVGYRDDREAAHARAAALERELADKEAALAAKEAELHGARAKLADKEAELAAARTEVRAEDEISNRDKARAKRKLDALSRKAKKRKRKAKKKREPEAAPTRDQERDKERDKRLLRSISLVAEAEVWHYFMIYFLPGIWLSFLLAISLGSPFGLVGFAITAAAALATFVGGKRWARSRLAAEHRWAQSLDFRLLGYSGPARHRAAQLGRPQAQSSRRTHHADCSPLLRGHGARQSGRDHERLRRRAEPQGQARVQSPEPGDSARW